MTFELAPRGNEVLLVVTHRRLEGRSLSTHARLEREHEAKL